MPTFGNTTPGGSSEYTGAPVYCKFTVNEGGTITDINAHISTAANCSWRGAIYADSSGAPTTKLAETGSAGAVNTPDTGAWYQLELSYVFTAGTYWLALWSSDSGGNMRYYYDAGGTNQATLEFGETYPNWPNPSDASPSLARNVSIYVNYTTGGGGGGGIPFVTRMTAKRVG